MFVCLHLNQQKKIPDPYNAKKNSCNSCNVILISREKNTKSVIIEHPKILPKLFKAIRQTEKAPEVGSSKSSICPLYSKTKTAENFLDDKRSKQKKNEHVF